MSEGLFRTTLEALQHLKQPYKRHELRTGRGCFGGNTTSVKAPYPDTEPYKTTARASVSSFHSVKNNHLKRCINIHFRVVCNVWITSDMRSATHCEQQKKKRLNRCKGKIYYLCIR